MENLNSLRGSTLIARERNEPLEMQDKSGGFFRCLSQVDWFVERSLADDCGDQLWIWLSLLMKQVAETKNSAVC